MKASDESAPLKPAPCAWNGDALGRLLLDDRGSVRNCNGAAQQTLSQPGSPLRVAGTALRGVAKLMQRAAGVDLQSHPRALSMTRAGAAALTLRMDATPAGLIVTLCDPDWLQPDSDLLRDLFGLTAAEARVVAGLATGQSTGDMALQQGIQTNTVQVHLKRAMHKCGVKHQAALVALVLRSAALVVVGPSSPPSAHTPPARPRKPGGEDQNLPKRVTTRDVALRTLGPSNPAAPEQPPSRHPRTKSAR